MEDIEHRMKIRGYIILIKFSLQRTKDTGYRRQDKRYKTNIYDMEINIQDTEIMIKILRKGFMKKRQDIGYKIQDIE